MTNFEKWEYKIVDSQIFADKFTLSKGKFLSHIAGHFNEFGKEGWELWEIMERNSTQFSGCCIFRRRVAP
jgi:hypothetical protein